MNTTSRTDPADERTADITNSDEFINIQPADVDRTAAFRREYLHDVIDAEVAATRQMSSVAPPTVVEPIEPTPSSIPLVILAVVATLVLLAAAAFTLLPGDSAVEPTEPGPTLPVPTDTVAPAVPASAGPVATPAVDVVDTPAVPEPVVDVPSPLPPVPLPDDADSDPADEGQPAVDVLPVAPAPVAPDTTVPPPPPPPAPAPLLAVQSEHQLDPGVEAVTVTFQNQGEATLHYEIVNDGDGFTADQPVGDIAAGDTADVWVDLDVAPDGDGPTPFQRVLDVRSDGGDAQITIDGQVEKPGHLIAEFESLPMVDYRATVQFTNVGGLALEIVGLDAPGLTVGPLPDTIAAGETIEIDIAICEGATGLPVFVPHAVPPHPLPQFQIASWVALETDRNTEATAVTSWTFGFAPPSCTPVIAPVTDAIVLGP